MVVRYTVVFERDEDGWFVASAPAIGCAAQGRTRPAAVRALREAVESYVAARRARGWPIPRESNDTVSAVEISV
ncbi:MAG: type II toxin-antitoxin system HicB family antitoxin [Deltaproteobacteria bacterium]|nr:type II toxin-antitoxin system HicB family antitoxin [Deltaproteobacteria bacterium]